MRPHSLLGALLFAGALPATACVTASDDDVVLGTRPETPSFPSPNASSTADEPGGGMCPSNECPEGRLTCPNTPYPCSVDLRSDDKNCGACGVICHAGPRHVMRCVDGACRLLCEDGYADCNGLLDDGCEVHVSGPYANDENNCGACGKVCDVCIDGICGCPSGTTLCPNGCQSLDTDNKNCGSCGNVCPSSEGLPPFPPTWNAGYSCGRGRCNQPACYQGFSDCNTDFGDPDGDGCETKTLRDPKNCGACGYACAPGEMCLRGTCICPCGSSCFTSINSDIDNCGTCSTYCGGNRDSITGPASAFGLDPAHGRPVCDQGVCGYSCSRGFADCDGDSANGCETRLLDDPLNCGGCGVRCTGIEGQACVDGECLTKECVVR